MKSSQVISLAKNFWLNNVIFQ